MKSWAVIDVPTQSLATSTTRAATLIVMVEGSGVRSMITRRLRTWSFAVAAIGGILFGGARQARADILLTLSAGTDTESFDFASNTLGATAATIDGYNLTIETVVTTFPGSSAGGQISTTVNVLGTVTDTNSLTATVQLIAPGSVPPGGPYITPPFNYSAQPLLAWTGPSTSPVTVSAGASFSPSVNSGTPTVTTTTYYNSGPASTFAGSTPVVSQTQNPLVNSVTRPNAGTYSLSQTVVLSGISLGASGFNYGGTSSVNAVQVQSVPEPSSMVLAGVGALGMIGYGLRRRKAMGA